MTSKRQAIFVVIAIFLVGGVVLYMLQSQTHKEAFEVPLTIRQIPETNNLKPPMPPVRKEIPQLMPQATLQSTTQVVPPQIPPPIPPPIPQMMPGQIQEMMPKGPLYEQKLLQLQNTVQATLNKFQTSPPMNENTKRLQQRAIRDQQIINDILKCNKIQQMLSESRIDRNIQIYNDFLSSTPVTQTIRNPTLFTDAQPTMANLKSNEVIPIDVHIKELNRVSKAANLFIDMNNQGRIPVTEETIRLLAIANQWRDLVPMIIVKFQSNPSETVKPLLHREVVETANKLNTSVQNYLVA